MNLKSKLREIFEVFLGRYELAIKDQQINSPYSSVQRFLVVVEQCLVWVYRFLDHAKM